MPIASADEGPSTGPRAFGRIKESYSLRLGLAGSGPVLFNDTPDAKLEQTTVFQYGGSADFLWGSDLLDLHRLGLGIGYFAAAHSDSRTLDFVTPHLTYEIGHPLTLQVRLGYAVTRGTEGFASNYAGVYSSATLGWSFRQLDAASAVGMHLGLTGQVILPTEGRQYASAFLGAQLTLSFNHDGGRR